MCVKPLGRVTVGLHAERSSLCDSDEMIEVQHSDGVCTMFSTACKYSLVV